MTAHELRVTLTATWPEAPAPAWYIDSLLDIPSIRRDLLRFAAGVRLIGCQPVGGQRKTGHHRRHRR